MRARFHVPVYDGDDAHVSSPDGERLELHDDEGGLCADGAAALGDPVAPPDVDDWPDVPQTIAPPPASPEVLVPGTAFGLEPHGFHADKHVEYLADVREELPLYREHGVAHPGLDPPRRQLRAVRQRPPRPVDPRRVGRPALRRRSRTARRSAAAPSSPRSGSTRATASCASTSSTPPTASPVARTDHTAIYRPRGPRPNVCERKRSACGANLDTDVGRFTPGRGWRRSPGRTRCG